MSGLKKFRDCDTGESELEVYDNDSGQIVLTVGDQDDFRSHILDHAHALALRDHLTVLLTIQREAGS